MPTTPKTTTTIYDYIWLWFLAHLTSQMTYCYEKLEIWLHFRRGSGADQPPPDPLFLVSPPKNQVICLSQSEPQDRGGTDSLLIPYQSPPERGTILSQKSCHLSKPESQDREGTDSAGPAHIARAGPRNNAISRYLSCPNIYRNIHKLFMFLARLRIHCGINITLFN